MTDEVPTFHHGGARQATLADTEWVGDAEGAGGLGRSDGPAEDAGPAAAGASLRRDGVEVRMVGGWFPLRGPADVDDEPPQEIDPNAWSLNPEYRAREAAAYDDQPEVVPVTADTWFVEAGDALAQAYCVTLVRGVNAEDALARMEAKRVGRGPVTFDDLVNDEVDHDDDEQVVGAAAVGDWTLLLEKNGFVTTDPRRRRALSKGTTVVTLYLNFNGANEFSLTSDGVEELTFDRMFPAERKGTRAVEFDDDLWAAGFVFDEEEAAAADYDGMRDEVAGCALVERLTRVRLTVGLLTGLTWRTGLLKY